MSVVTKDTIQPSSGQALTIKDEGGTASITVQTDGDLTLAENAYLGSGKGIYFDGQTTSANFLDDYEEGTWTVASPAGNTDTQTGIYTKIGRVVICNIYFKFSSTDNDTTQVTVNLPFTVGHVVGETLSSSGAISYWSALNGSRTSMGILALNGEANALLTHSVSNTNNDFMLANTMNAAFKFVASITYFVA